MAEWKKYNEYIEVSSDGNVKSHGKLIKGESCTNGYIRIHVSHNGITQKHLLHRIVAQAFIPNPHNLPVVNHIDGNKHNNAVENLEWCTYGENLKHAYRNNLRSAVGENNNASKLTTEKVNYIRNNYIKGSREFGFAALARKFGVNAKTVENAYKGMTW